MILLTVLSLLLIVSYTIGVCAYTRGIPYSISETYYKIKHKFWFAVATIGTAALLMPAILEVTREQYQFLAFLACVGMILTGAAPNFREGIERKIHIAGAFICLVFSQLWVAYCNGGYSQSRSIGGNLEYRFYHAVFADDCIINLCISGAYE